MDMRKFGLKELYRFLASWRISAFYLFRVFVGGLLA
jgi:hypothetical protein